MNPDQLRPLDWQRILFGQNPGWFVLEVIGRALFIYVIMLTYKGRHRFKTFEVKELQQGQTSIRTW
jgi:hypothetical protein